MSEKYGTSEDLYRAHNRFSREVEVYNLQLVNLAKVRADEIIGLTVVDTTDGVTTSINLEQLVNNLSLAHINSALNLKAAELACNEFYDQAIDIDVELNAAKNLEEAA
jgi:hypothetical protein